MQQVEKIKKDLYEYIKKNPFHAIVIVGIILLAIFFRTYNYSSRISIQADNSRDVQVATYAADNQKIPQIGQFSSAGPFFYGPWYYWWLTLIEFIPLGLFTPWYVMSFLSLIFIGLLYWLGKEIGGKWMGTTAALFAAISPAQVDNAFDVWNPASTPLLIALGLIFLIRFYKYRKTLDLFLLGFITSLAFTIHFQNILAMPVVLVALAATRPSLKNIVFLLLGLTLPFIPMIISDSKLHWYNFNSLFIYLAIDQYSVWVPNRWLTYIGSYWPETWASIIGAHKYIGTFLIGVFGILTLLKIKQAKENKIFFLIAITFALEIVMFRYYRGSRFPYYSLFAHVPVLLLSAWACAQTFKIQKTAGFILIGVVTIATFSYSLTQLKDARVNVKNVNALKSELYAKFPGEKFDIYGCKYNAGSISHPLALFMYNEKREDVADGIKIATCEGENGEMRWTQLTNEEAATSELYDPLWHHKTTAIVYRDTVEWWKAKPPPKNGEFWNFVKRKLSPKCWPHCE